MQQMLTEGRDCRDVVTQMSAANKALEQAGFVARGRRADVVPRGPRALRRRGLRHRRRPEDVHQAGLSPHRPDPSTSSASASRRDPDLPVAPRPETSDAMTLTEDSRPLHPRRPLGGADGLLARIGRAVGRRPRRVLAVWAIVVLASAPLAVTLTARAVGRRVGGAGVDRRGGARRAAPRLPGARRRGRDRRLPPGRPHRRGPAGLGRARGRRCRAAPGTTSRRRPADPAPAEAGLISPDGRAALVPVGLEADDDADLPEAAGEVMATVARRRAARRRRGRRHRRVGGVARLQRDQRAGAAQGRAALGPADADPAVRRVRLGDRRRAPAAPRDRRHRRRLRRAAPRHRRSRRCRCGR